MKKVIALFLAVILCLTCFPKAENVNASVLNMGLRGLGHYATGQIILNGKYYDCSGSISGSKVSVYVTSYCQGETARYGSVSALFDTKSHGYESESADGRWVDMYSTGTCNGPWVYPANPDDTIGVYSVSGTVKVSGDTTWTGSL